MKNTNLEQYQCHKCGRFFQKDKSEFDLDFGCPFGCNDNGELVRIISIEVRGVDKIKKSYSDDPQI